ncbi:type IV pilin [Salinadaptatus halalkaliphilus]|uniref:Type IV pilin n=2 Tax=Salinadaptatus halalkaliphilus TaxID=2419781 RepID=A0A4S3TLB8_9EURY|nr:type IV pilin [Salinadaptatus halalkaliphilus]
MFDGKQIANKLVGSKDERAVSPVIGVILMVAITVILAAVIAAFVMDLGDMSGSANAGIDFDEEGDLVTVQVIDEGNTDAILVEVDAESASSGEDTRYVDYDGDDDGDGDNPWTVGDSLTLDSDDIDDEGEYNSGELEDGINGITVYGEIDGDLQVVATWDN